MSHELRLWAESDALSISKMNSDNSRFWGDLHEKDAYLDKLWKELDGLWGDTDFKTLQISKLTSEVNSKGDFGANLWVD